MKKSFLPPLCLLFTATLAASSPVAVALPKDDIRDPQTDAPGCNPSASASIKLLSTGLPLQSSTVQVSAATSKLVAVDTSCEQTLYPLSSSKWELSTKPAGSSAALGDAGSPLLTKLTLDKTGSYTVKFTACPSGCSVSIPGEVTKNVPSVSKVLTLNVVDRIVIPPQTEPLLPSQTATSPTAFPDANAKCQDGGGLIDPQWVTVMPWNGAQSYELLEGKVYRSRISSIDNPLNHDSQDHNFYVVPDPPYRRLLSTKPEYSTEPDGMGIEWERDQFPEGFRPTPGDRVSVFGYWIHDCGHSPFYTEIHPPIGIAVHRSRPIQIPSSALFNFGGGIGTTGSNVYVPGIVTDLFFNRNSGEITRNCSNTGLHQPSGGACIKGPSPINRKFSFNIYLPRDPQAIVAEKGKAAPPVPLYYQTLNPLGAGGLDPAIAVQKEGDKTYLKVEVDLSTFTGTQYSRKIVAGWVYPSPNNWELKRWKVRLTSLDVHDDGDGLLRGDGDWRFWVNTNNGVQEWTKLFDCDGCVTGKVTFGGRPWETGSSAADRSLGSDPLLYPNQMIWIHTSGFEADTIYSDGIGFVNDLRPQQPGEYHTRDYCKPNLGASCAHYTLNYQILEGSPVGAASLSSAAQALYDTYAITSNVITGPILGPVLNVPVRNVPGITISPIESLPLQTFEPIQVHPIERVLLPTQQPIVFKETVLFRSQPLESFALTGISVEKFRDLSSTSDPARRQKLDAMAKQLREEVNSQLGSSRSAEVLLDLLPLKEALPADLWAKYFGDLDSQLPSIPTRVPQPER